MLTEDFCSFEVAKLLKEKGFNEPCMAYYTTSTHKGHEVHYDVYSPCNSDLNIIFCNMEFGSLPTHQMAMKWLREEKRTSIIIEFDLTRRGYCPYVYQLDYDMDWVVKWRVNTPMKYEEAVEVACIYALKNLL